MMRALKLFGAAVSLYSPLLNISYLSNYIEVDWNDLSGKVIHNKNVVLAKYDDIHFFNGPVFLCEMLFLIQCDKNFAFYWLDNRTFPNLKEVYLGSHPCESSVLTRNQVNVHLHETYTSYKESWWWNNDNINLISGETFEAILKEYDGESEEFIMSENRAE